MPSVTSWRSPDVAWLRHEIRAYARGYFVLILLATIGGLPVVLDPLVMRWLLDTVIPSHEARLLAVAAVMFLLSYIGRVYLDQKTNLLSTRLTHVSIVALRLSVLTHFLKLPAEYHDRMALGESLFHINDDARQVAETVATAAVQTTRFAATTAATLAAMLWVNARLTLLIVPLVIVHALLKRRWIRGVAQASEIVQQESAGVSALTQQIGSGVLQIQLLGCEKRMLRRFAARGRAVRDSVIARKLWDCRFAVLSRTFVAIGVTIVLAYGGYLVAMQALTVGALVALYTYMTRICEPLTSIIDLDSRTERARTSLRHLHKIVADSSANTPPGRNVVLPHRRNPPWIAFDHVSFAYPGRPTVLADIHFSIAPGSHVVIAGATGSGKTTIFKILLQSYSGYRGSIRLNGIEVSEIDPRSLRTHFAVVTQETLLFDGSLRENLLLANQAATHRELEAAIAYSQLEPLVRRLPKGLDEPVGPQGTQLSGGEKQRLALARAVLQDAPVLLLDEFTSGLDMLVEATILGELANHFEDRTIIAISHRPAVMNWAHVVLAVQNGEIVKPWKGAMLKKSEVCGTQQSTAGVVLDGD